MGKKIADLRSSKKGEKAESGNDAKTGGVRSYFRGKKDEANSGKIAEKAKNGGEDGVFGRFKKPV